MACYSQVEKLIHNLNGKGIEFKNKYETVVADYETDTTTFVTKSNQTVDLAA